MPAQLTGVYAICSCLHNLHLGQDVHLNTYILFANPHDCLMLHSAPPPILL